jgi:hypothetical protein
LAVVVVVGVRDGLIVWMTRVAVHVGVGDVCVAVDVAGMGMRDGIPVTTFFTAVGVESGRDDWQAVRTRTKMKRERLSNMVF